MLLKPARTAIRLSSDTATSIPEASHSVEASSGNPVTTFPLPLKDGPGPPAAARPVAGHDAAATTETTIAARARTWTSRARGPPYPRDGGWVNTTNGRPRAPRRARLARPRETPSGPTRRRRAFHPPRRRAPQQDGRHRSLAAGIARRYLRPPSSRDHPPRSPTAETIGLRDGP